MIKRIISEKIKSKLFKGKAIIIIGARQVGKTTLIKSIAESYKESSIFLNCDEPDIRAMLTDANSSQLKRIVGRHKLVIIDEAQRVKNIGLTIKLFVDSLKDKQLIATGSSSLELANEINEPLTGRKYEYILYPFSVKEIIDETGEIEFNRQLEERILYGMYPEIATKQDEKKELLLNITESYLFRDILAISDLRKPEILETLIQALALQIGNQVSFNELAQLLKVDNETVTKYIELLEKSYVIFRLKPFSRNLRNELKRTRKIYFYDTGIRNAIINNFNNLEFRDDRGALWENFFISESIKFLNYKYLKANSYFWRTKQQQEIDLVQDFDNKLQAFEVKWNPKVKKKFPQTFLNAYPKCETLVANPENYFQNLDE